MRTIVLKLTLSGEDEYECQDESTLLVVDKFVLCHLPKTTDIQIISDSIDKENQIDIEKIMKKWDFWRKRIAEGDKSDAPIVWFGSVIDSFPV